MLLRSLPPDFYSLTREELARVLSRTEFGSQPTFRSKQLHQAVYREGKTSPCQIATLPKTLREALGDTSRFTWGRMNEARLLTSRDGTRKWGWKLVDGQVIESVLMKYDDGRSTACVSSQAGCAQRCSFCATGQMGFARQLDSSEIFEQAARLHVRSLQDGRTGLSNVVFMGMGEPLANLRAVKEAALRMHRELGVAMRKMTVSTVGIAPSISKFAEEIRKQREWEETGADAGWDEKKHEDMAALRQLHLAVSLHAATDEKRSAIIPANRRWSIEELMESVRDYQDATRGKRVSFEYALISGQNDTVAEAKRLATLMCVDRKLARKQERKR